MFKKKTALNVRPQPPSFAEMTEDINSADSNDIIFTQLKSGMMDDQCYHCATYGGAVYQCAVNPEAEGRHGWDMEKG